MIRSLILALAIIATATALPNTFDFRPDAGEDELLTEPPPICPPPGLEVNATTFANHYNCSTYWLCESGVPTLKACPPGLNFNVILGVCDFPWATTCDPISPIMPAGEMSASRVNAACSPTGAPTCPPPGGDPNANATVCGNPYNCSTYYYCTNGIAVLRSCPIGLEYNAAVEVCDFVWAANCVALPPPQLEYEPMIAAAPKELECQADGPPICPPPGGPIGNVTQCPNPYNCSAYYYCDNGVAKPGDCPPELEFNAALGVCDFPWNANCVEIPEPVKEAVNVGTHDLECQADGPPICPPPGGPVGNVTQCPNPYNCSAYYYCDNGVAKPGDCPPDLEFNAVLGVCDFPWNANCEELETTTVDPTTASSVNFAKYQLTKDLECQADGPPICPPPGGPIGNVTQCPNPYNCSAYYYCDNGHPHDAGCPPGLEFNAVLGVCDFPWNANCEEIPEPVKEVVVFVGTHDLECQADGPPICPPPGGPVGNVTQCPNPYNCSAYYYCDNGVAKPGDCPPDLEFNAVLGVCDFPWNANCEELETTTAEPTTESSVDFAKYQLTKDLECQDQGPPICPPPGGPTGNVTVCPNHLNCSLYYYCDNGHPHEAECPPGLEFNAALGVCDFPWNANCVEVTTTEATTVTTTETTTETATSDTTTTDTTTTDIPTETTTAESKFIKYKFAHLKNSRRH